MIVPTVMMDADVDTHCIVGKQDLRVGESEH